MCNLVFTLLNGRGDDMDFRESEARPFRVDVHIPPGPARLVHVRPDLRPRDRRFTKQATKAQAWIGVDVV